MTKIIDDYVKKNFIDGINIESSPGYQCHCLVYIIRYIYTLCKINKTKLISNILLETYLNVYDKFNLFLRNDNTLPIIGDTNLTLDIFNFPEEEYNQLYKMHCFICDHMKLKEKNYNYDTYFKMHSSTGYIFCKDNKTSLIIRTNPDIFTYHTHDDNISFHLSHNVFDWISDTGSYPSKREYFNSRIAHNCIVRNLMNEELTNKKFHSKQLNEKHYIIIFSNSNFKHTREIIFHNSKYITLKDTVENKDIYEKTKFNQLFHTGSNVKIKNVKEHAIDLVYEKQKEKVSIIQKNINSKLETFYGSIEPYLGWIAEDPSNIKKTYTLSFTSVMANTIEYETDIIISDAY
jgi:hypothetical protein